MADYPKPSAYTPFVRRWFTDEKKRELKETQELYERVREQHNRFAITPIGFGSAIIRNVRDYVSTTEEMELRIASTIMHMVDAEDAIFSLPVPNFEAMSMKEFSDYRALLRQKEFFFANQETVIPILDEVLSRIFTAIALELPQMADPSPFTIPLVYALSKPGEFMAKMYHTACEPMYQDRGLLSKLRAQLYINICNASGIEPFTHAKKPYIHAHTSELPLNELTDAYLGQTPFHSLFYTPVPLKLTHAERMNHMHIIGGTGAGKTTLLENLIMHDLTMPNTPGLVIVDPHGDLLKKLTRLDLFHPDHGRLADRFVYITPRDIKNPPALNIFDVKRERLGTYDEAMKEQVIAGVIQTFDYVFEGLIGADLTAKQGVFFRYLARLMLAIPETGVLEGNNLVRRNATILDMMRLMDDVGPYRKAIESLPPIQREFFEREFLDPKATTFKQTREQIRYRLQAIIENPTMARLFTSPYTKVDIFEELNNGSIIFVDTAKDFLKGAHSHFGRIFISLVLQAVLERAALPETERRPAFLIVDEAASYFDSNIDDLLTDARKYKLGCVFAHQYLEQCTGPLRASLAANTAAKFASGVSHADARSMAPEMRTTPKFIQQQPRLQFACHIRNITPQAVSIPVELGRVSAARQLSDADRDRLLERNRLRVSIQEMPAPARPISPEDDEDIAPVY